MEPNEKSTIFDLEILKKNLEDEKPQFDEMNNQWFVQIYIGSVMNILPSGMYYTPFACSNVEICKTCIEAEHVPCTEKDPCWHPDDSEDTEEYHCDACKDARWHEHAEKELKSINACLVSGEGDPTDMFVYMIAEEPTNEQ